MLRNAQALGPEVERMRSEERRTREVNGFADMLRTAFGGGGG